MWYSSVCVPLNPTTSWCSNSSQVFRYCGNGCLYKKYNTTITATPSEGELAFLRHRDGLHSCTQEADRKRNHVLISPKHTLMNKLTNSITRHCFQPAVGQRPPMTWTLSCTSEGPKPRHLQNGQASGVGQKSYTIPASYTWLVKATYTADTIAHSLFLCNFAFLPKNYIGTYKVRRGRGSRHHHSP